MTFKQNIASQTADGSSKIRIYVRKEVFDSDEAIVQILSHEISETQELRHLAAKPLSTTEYKNLVRADRVENLPLARMRPLVGVAASLSARSR